MAVQPVCAVIVTFHPGAATLKHIPEIMAQVARLVVVDNASHASEIALLRMASRDLGFYLIENKENFGIAQALNQGVQWAESEGHRWVVLFDQDSTVTNGLIAQMFGAWQSHPHRDLVGSIHPRYVDPQTGLETAVPRSRDGNPIFPMTSGSLMPTWIFNRIGWFLSDYFIDLVDWEYSFRIRAAGYLVIDAQQAKLFHAPGNPKKTTVLGITFHTTYHSPVRRYFFARNSIVFYKKYFVAFPSWILMAICIQLRDAMKCFVAEPDRTRNVRSFLLGTWDGLKGRVGPRRDY